MRLLGRRRHPHDGPDRGAGSALVVGVGAALLLTLTALLALASVLTTGARARTAADLAALAGAGRLLVGDSGDQACAVAGRVAADNDGRLRHCQAGRDGTGAPTLSVVVGVDLPVSGLGQARASARAGGVPRPMSGTTAVAHSGPGDRR